MGKYVHLFAERIDFSLSFCYTVAMVTSYDVEHLRSFLQSFYTAVEIRISVFDDTFKLITEYPEAAPEYCRLIRESKTGAQGCRACDIAAFQEAKKRRGLYVYTCHAGLTEAVAPIKLGDGVLGYVILAHMLPKESLENALKNALNRAQFYGLDKEKATRALTQIQPFSHEKINAASALMDAIASYLHISNWVQWKNENVADQISKYVELHLHENLSSATLCKVFFLSRTKLHQIATVSYGLSISKYVLFKRISKAKALLEQGVSIESVAERTGFANANYFCKAFKRETGRSPGAYKRKYAEKK